MVLGEILLLELWRRSHFCRHLIRRVRVPPEIVALDAIELSGYELQTGVMEGRAAVVYDSDPAVEVGVFFVARDGQNVIRIPGQVAREIGSFNLLFSRAGIFEGHQECGPL